MTRTRHTSDATFTGELSVVTALSTRVMDAAMLEMKREDELTLALKHLLRAGENIDNLSAASGLTPAEIKRRVKRELTFGDDLASLSGTR